MPQQQSPFLEGKYGWNYGESGWNTGMDENLLKFSFMFDGNVDSIVASLPPVSNGAAHFNIADNRFYFGIDSVWYSSPCPKSFIFKIKSNGDFYQFNGVSAVKIDNPSEIGSRLDAVELTLSSLGTAAFQNVEDFATQAELDIVEGQAQSYTDTLRQDLANPTDTVKGAGQVARSVITVTSLSNLAATPTGMGQGVSLVLGGRSGLFFFQSGDLSAQVAADPMQGVYVAPTSDPTGVSGAWVRQGGQSVGAFGGLQIGWFGAIPDRTVNNSPAIQAALDLANYLNIGRVVIGNGDFGMSDTVNLDKGRTTLTGGATARVQAGSPLANSNLTWNGGAAPMFSQTATWYVFEDFGVTNTGSATDWLELNSGAQGNTYNRLYFFVPSGATRFSRSVIRSNGNRCGYSTWNAIRATSPAPIFLDIDGQGTPNGITPIEFKDRCIFGGTNQNFTIIKIKDETIENIKISSCTFNQYATAELCIVDTSEAPLSRTIGVLDVNNCEIDSVGDAGWRQFKLANVRNFSFKKNYITGGGAVTAIGALTNTNINIDENDYSSINGPLFDVDAACTARVGRNNRTTSNTEGEFNQPAAGFVQIPYTSVMLVDGQRVGQDRHAIFRADITNNAGYQFRVGVAKPYATLPGQVFTVVIRNVSGGTIAVPTFSNFFKTAGATTAPADGFCRSFTFYFDGVNAIELYRSQADVPNS